MNNLFKERLFELQQQSPKAFEALASATEIGRIEKGNHLLEIGKISSKIFFIETGALRHYHIDEQGKEVSTWFSFEGDLVVAMDSFISQQLNKEGIEVLEDCAFTSISRQVLLPIFQTYHPIETIYRELMEQYFIRLENRLFRIQTHSAKQKYAHLIEHQPHIVQRIPLHYIASYLGVSKETISRIRRDFRG